MSEVKQPSKFAVEKAAQIWCTHLNEKTIMNTNLAMEFAKVIDEIRSEAYLGNATTSELIYELSARCDTGSINEGGDYKTTNKK